MKPTKEEAELEFSRPIFPRFILEECMKEREAKKTCLELGIFATNAYSTLLAYASKDIRGKAAIASLRTLTSWRHTRNGNFKSEMSQMRQRLGKQRLL